MLIKIFSIVSLILFPSLVYSKNLNIVATIKPIQSIIQNIVGDQNQVDLLVTKSSSPHFYTLKPSDLKKIHTANLIFFIDEHFEIFLSKFIENKQYKNKFINLSNNKALTLYKNRDSKFWQEIASTTSNKHHHSHHDHDHDHKLDHSHEHEDHHIHNSDETDFHIWLDTHNVKIMAEQIFHSLVNIDPKNKDTYANNLQIFLNKLEVLEAKIAKNLINLKDKKFIVFHDAYQYLDRKYNLSPAGVVLMNPMHKSTIKELSSLINKIKSENISCLFSEPQFNQAIIDLIIKNTKINTAVLDAEWGIDNDNISTNEAYFYMIDKIIFNMNKCLN